MKLTSQQIKLLSDAIYNVINRYGKEKLSAYKFDLENDSRVKDANKRFRWDLFYASGITIGDGIGLPGDIEGNFNNNHIDTALKRIVKDKDF